MYFFDTLLFVILDGMLPNRIVRVIKSDRIEFFG